MKQPSWRSVLPVHPAAELFPRMSPDELRVLGEDIRKHGLHEPITVVRQYRRRADGTLHVGEYDLVLLDGRNRLEAMERAGFALIRDRKLDKTLGHRALGLEPLAGGGYAELDSGVDPYAFVISRNIRRRHLTAEQKRDLIAALLKADPAKSDRTIGEMVKADHKTVGAVRAEKEATGEIPPVEKRVGKDRKARKQPAKKAATTKKPQAPHAAHERRAAQQETKAAHAVDKPKLAGDGKAWLYCSFCGKSQHDVQLITNGFTNEGRWLACICNECVDECVKILAERRAATGKAAPAADDSLDIPEFLPRSTGTAHG